MEFPVTSRWREYNLDYRELMGKGFIASLIPSLCVNDCPTEAYIGIARRKKQSLNRDYLCSVAYVWDTERFERRDSHGVLIYFFDEQGKSLGGQEAGGSHQFPHVRPDDKSKLIKILQDFTEFKPKLASLTHPVIVSLQG